VRISPWELHVDDPDGNEPYKVSSRVNKDHWYYAFVGSSEAAFGTADHDQHRVRRKAQQAYFSQDAVARFDTEQEKITSKLCSRLEEFKGTGQPVNLSDAFGCVATDAVTGYCFHKSYNVLDSPDFAASSREPFVIFRRLGFGIATSGTS
jgi:cytochrome P450